MPDTRAESSIRERERAGWDFGRIGRRSFPSPKVTGGRFEDDRRLESDVRRGVDFGGTLEEEESFDAVGRETSLRVGSVALRLSPLGPFSVSLGVRPCGFDGMCKDPNSIDQWRLKNRSNELKVRNMTQPNSEIERQNSNSPTAEID